MTIAFRGGSGLDQIEFTNQNSRDLTYPSGVVAGDYGQIGVSWYNDQGTKPTATGCTELAPITLSSGNFLTVLERTFAGSVSGNFAVTMVGATSGYGNASLMVFSGSSLTRDGAHSSQVNASSTSCTGPGITTSSANEMLIGWFGANDATTVSAGGSGMTLGTDAENVGANSENGFYQAIASAGATGTRTVTLGTARPNGAIMSAIKEGGGAGPAGDASQTVGNITQSAAGSVTVSGDASQTAGNITQSATGSITVTGDATQTVDDATQVADGVAASGSPVAGDASQTVGGIAQVAAGSGGWTVGVTWTDIAGEDQYRLKWGTASGVYDFIVDLPADTTSYDIGGLQAGTTYYVRVWGLTLGIENTPSDELSFVVGQPIGDAPQTVAPVTQVADGSVTVTGDASQTVGDVTQSADGNASQPPFEIAPGAMARNRRFSAARAWRIRQETARRLFN